MKDVAVLLEHVDLLNAGDGRDTKLLEGSLDLGRVALRRGHRLLDLLTAGSALAAYIGELSDTEDRKKKVEEQAPASAACPTPEVICEERDREKTGDVVTHSRTSPFQLHLAIRSSTSLSFTRYAPMRT